MKLIIKKVAAIFEFKESSNGVLEDGVVYASSNMQVGYFNNEVEVHDTKEFRRFPLADVSYNGTVYTVGSDLLNALKTDGFANFKGGGNVPPPAGGSDPLHSTKAKIYTITDSTFDLQATSGQTVVDAIAASYATLEIDQYTLAIFQLNDNRSGIQNWMCNGGKGLATSFTSANFEKLNTEVLRGVGENYRYVDLISANTAVNTAILQDAIDRASGTTPYGQTLGDTNRFTIYATGKVDSINVYDFINLCSPAGFLEFNLLEKNSISEFNSQDFINIKVNNVFNANSSTNLKIEGSSFADGFSAYSSTNLKIEGSSIAVDFSANNSQNLKIEGSSIAYGFSAYSSTNLKIEGSSIAGKFGANNSQNLKIEGSSFLDVFSASSVNNISIKNSKIDDASPDFSASNGLIYNTILSPVNVSLPLKIRGCLNLNNDVIPNN